MAALNPAAADGFLLVQPPGPAWTFLRSIYYLESFSAHRPGAAVFLFLPAVLIFLCLYFSVLDSVVVFIDTLWLREFSVNFQENNQCGAEALLPL